MRVLYAGKGRLNFTSDLDIVFDFEIEPSLVNGFQVQSVSAVFLTSLFLLALYKSTFKWIRGATLLIVVDGIYLCLFLTQMKAQVSPDGENIKGKFSLCSIVLCLSIWSKRTMLLED